MYRGVLKTTLWVAICSFALVPKSFSAIEETFPTLQVGTRVYTNVTVTTKAKKYIFIQHSSGMENIKVGDLPEDIRTQLGYVPEVTKAQKASNWAKGKVAGVHIGEVRAAQLQDPKMWKEQSVVVLEKARALDRKLCGAILGAGLLLYLFFAFCCMLICRKAGTEPGMLIWFPLFQLLPLLRAARMSPVWFVMHVFVMVAPFATFLMPPPFALGCLLFVLFLTFPLCIAFIIWSFKIASARGKSPLVGFCLMLPLFDVPAAGALAALAPPLIGLSSLLPVVSLLTFLYLAFSDGVPAEPIAKEDKRTAHLMTLETA
jgi:hypothetical protein